MVCQLWRADYSGVLIFASVMEADDGSNQSSASESEQDYDGMRNMMRASRLPNALSSHCGRRQVACERFKWLRVGIRG